jgi:hypothetical protein
MAPGMSRRATHGSEGLPSFWSLFGAPCGEVWHSSVPGFNGAISILEWPLVGLLNLVAL